jgi:hypothetical protein
MGFDNVKRVFSQEEFNAEVETAIAVVKKRCVDVAERTIVDAESHARGEDGKVIAAALRALPFKTELLDLLLKTAKLQGALEQHKAECHFAACKGGDCYLAKKLREAATISQITLENWK